MMQDVFQQLAAETVESDEIHAHVVKLIIKPLSYYNKWVQRHIT